MAKSKGLKSDAGFVKPPSNLPISQPSSSSQDDNDYNTKKEEDLKKNQNNQKKSEEGKGELSSIFSSLYTGAPSKDKKKGEEKEESKKGEQKKEDVQIPPPISLTGNGQNQNKKEEEETNKGEKKAKSESKNLDKQNQETLMNDLNLGSEDDLLNDSIPSRKPPMAFKLKFLIAGAIIILIMLLFGYFSFLKKLDEKEPETNDNEEESGIFSFFKAEEGSEKEPETSPEENTDPDEQNEGNFWDKYFDNPQQPEEENNNTNTDTNQAPKEDPVAAEQNEQEDENKSEENKYVNDINLINQIDSEFNKMILEVDYLDKIKGELYNFSKFNINEDEIIQLVIKLNGQDISLNELNRSLNLNLPNQLIDFHKFALVLIREDGFVKFAMIIRTNNNMEKNREILNGFENNMRNGFNSLYFGEPLTDPSSDEGNEFKPSMKFVRGRYINLSKSKSYYLNYLLKENDVIIGTSSELMIKIND